MHIDGNGWGGPCPQRGETTLYGDKHIVGYTYMASLWFIGVMPLCSLYSRNVCFLLLKWKNGWFQTFLIFSCTWGNDPIWLIFFKWVGSTTNVFSSHSIVNYSTSPGKRRVALTLLYGSTWSHLLPRMAGGTWCFLFVGLPWCGISGGRKKSSSSKGVAPLQCGIHLAFVSGSWPQNPALYDASWISDVRFHWIFCCEKHKTPTWGLHWKGCLWGW